MTNQKKQYSTFIITGMHRSGTSLTSSLMESAGVNVGENLIGASNGNLKGHFEDLDFVEFHERTLSSLGISKEGWTLQKEIFVPQQLRDQASLVIKRNSKLHLWGWKDPRTTLFLRFWKDLLPNSYFVFAYRNPWEVVDSLYRRGDQIFHNNPKYALEIWSHYNKLILDFYQEFPDRSLLVNIDALMNDCSCISELCQKKFGVSLENPQEKIIDKSLMTKAVSKSSHRPLLIKSLFPEAIDILENLNRHADLPSEIFRFEDTIIEESFRDWAFQDWINICRSQSQLQQTQTELERSQHDLQQTQSKLDQTQTELERSQHDLQQTQSKLDQTQIELELSRQRIDQTQIELELSRQRIDMMQRSKFWHLRNIWFKIESLF